MFVTSYSVTYLMYTFRENREFVFISIVQFIMSANSRIRSGLQIVFVCLYISPSHNLHCANFIWRHWTYEMPVRYNFISVIHYTICGTVCFQFTHFLRNDWDNIHTLSHHQIGYMNYYPLFRVRSWNNGKRCMSFLILMVSLSSYMIYVYNHIPTYYCLTHTLLMTSD